MVIQYLRSLQHPVQEILEPEEMGQYEVEFRFAMKQVFAGKEASATS